MWYKKLYIQIIFRIVLIVANSIAFAVMLTKQDLIATKINLGLLIAVQTVLFIRYINQVNRDLAKFFYSIENNDSSIVFKNENYQGSYDELVKQLNRLSKSISQMKQEVLAKNVFLNQLVEQAGVGIIVFNDLGDIILKNKESHEILRMTKLINMRDIDSVYEGFSDEIKKIGINKQILKKLYNSMFELSLNVKKGELKLQDDHLYLLVFQDIHLALDKKESESWQKLIKILTHEIMNSVSPISSTVTTLNKIYNDENFVSSEKNIEKTKKGLNIIKNRSLGMMNFVNGFRDISNIPLPEKSNFKTHELISEIIELFSSKYQDNDISIELSNQSQDCSLYADQQQLMQVIINLVENSFDSLNSTEDGKIVLESIIENNRVLINVIDNGKGIPVELSDKIFVPFFTTKNKGMGIGLSLSRQIMINHGGKLVHSRANNRTIFKLILQV